MRTNWLARLFDWLGETFERFNPSAFRFLAAVLPYLTPIPVAQYTATNSSEFLNFTPEVAFIFVFALEGIGLWFTTMLVDSIVDWIRSKNWKSFTPVLMFALTVGAYVYILVNLNVTLENATGNMNPALSRVITLMCFLPLITGIGNGYYKLKLEYRTDLETTKKRNEELELRKWQNESEIRKSEQDAEIRKMQEQNAWELRKLQEQNALEFQKLQESNSARLRKFQIKQETSGSKDNISETLPEVTSRSAETSETNYGNSSKMGRPSVHQNRVFEFMEQYYSNTRKVPTFTEVMNELNLPQSTASRLRDKWIDLRGIRQ